MSTPDPYERTQRLDPSASGASSPDPTTPNRAAAPPPITYTEEYGQPAPERTLVDRGSLQGPGGAQVGGSDVGTEAGVEEGPEAGVEVEEPRSYSLTALIFTGVIALLVGVVLALALLPEEDTGPVVLDDVAQQQLVDAAAQRETDNAALQAENDQLRAELDARNAEVASLQAQAAGDQAAADQAAAERQAAQDQRDIALDERQAALDAREQAVADRETAVAQREQDQVAQDQAAQDQAAADQSAQDQAAADGGGRLDLPELPDLGDVQLPQIDEEQARGVVERFVDRIQDLLGL